MRLGRGTLLNTVSADIGMSSLGRRQSPYPDLLSQGDPCSSIILPRGDSLLRHGVIFGEIIIPCENDTKIWDHVHVTGVLMCLYGQYYDEMVHLANTPITSAFTLYSYHAPVALSLQYSL